MAFGNSENCKMRVLGIDPGYAIIGYGLVFCEKNRFRSLGHGAITTAASDDFLTRLQFIYDNMTELIFSAKPDAFAIEKLYFQNNQKTAIDVAQARGVTILAAKQANVPVYEYTPLQIKMSVTGYGQAKKYQMMEMTKRLLGLEEIPKPDDTADALAIAITHLSHAGMKERVMRK